MFRIIYCLITLAMPFPSLHSVCPLVVELQHAPCVCFLRCRSVWRFDYCSLGDTEGALREPTMPARPAFWKMSSPNVIEVGFFHKKIRVWIIMTIPHIGPVHHFFLWVRELVPSFVWHNIYTVLHHSKPGADRDRLLVFGSAGLRSSAPLSLVRI